MPFGEGIPTANGPCGSQSAAALRNNTAMTRARTNLLIATALLWAGTLSQGQAAILAPDALPATPDEKLDAFESCDWFDSALVDTFDASDAFDDIFGAGALPPERSDRDGRRDLRNLSGMAGSWSCEPASVAQSFSGTSPAAVAGDLGHVPEELLHTPLPREASLVLPPGLPFKLLRPA